MGKLKLMSFFSGAFGLDIGLEKAGFDVIWANEIEKDFANTIKLNRSKTNVSHFDITALDPKKVMRELGLTRSEIDLFAGGPPCQSFSTAGKRLSVNDARGNLMLHYIQWVNFFRPKYFILENVKGLLSAPIKHVPHAQRHKDWQPTTEEAHGSALRLILSEIEKIGYKVNYKLLNAADYGVPQTRQRVVIFGSRDGDLLEFPKPTHSKTGEDGLKPWVTLRSAFEGLCDKEPEFLNYPETRLKYLRQVPMGGNWRSLPEEIQEEAMGGAYKSGGGKVGFYRKLDWNKPSPTVTTSPYQKATDMCHPELDRPLSVREYARIQQFPDYWQFVGLFALPLLIIDKTVLPNFIVPGLLIANTVIVVLFQVRASRGADNVPGASKVGKESAYWLTAACILIAVLAFLPTALSIMGVIFIVLLLTASELRQASASWGLAHGLAPNHAQAEYIGTFNLYSVAQSVVGPALLIGAINILGNFAWLLTSVVILTAGLLLPITVRSFVRATTTEKATL